LIRAGIFRRISRRPPHLVAVAETHIHADYVSGARELAERVHAKLYVSDEGPAEWKYEYLQAYDHQGLTDGDAFLIGNVRFEAVHTPGHTPESLSFLLTDEGGGADRPMGIFTGDFVFVGSIGRPDLLEEAAGIAGTAESGARDLFASVQRFKQLPDYLQIWPAHGAGSACGKGLGAVPSSTVGYEKQFNPALQIDTEEEFVRYILADQPEAPTYFAVMKRVNKEGPALIGDAGLPSRQTASELTAVLQSATVIDLRVPQQFAERHVPGTINIPARVLATWAGWIVDYDRPVYLICDSGQLAEAVRVLRKIGMDQIAGHFDPDEVEQSGLATESYLSAAPQELASRMDAGAVRLLDVRSDEEWNASRIPAAEHRFLGRLPDSLDELDDSKTTAVQCQSGTRSAIAASILQASGFPVINLDGGLTAWQQAGLPVDGYRLDVACQAGSATC